MGESEEDEIDTHSIIEEDDSYGEGEESYNYSKNMDRMFMQVTNKNEVSSKKISDTPQDNLSYASESNTNKPNTDDSSLKRE